MEKKMPLPLRIMELQNAGFEILKTKKAYGYNYAPLETIIPVLLPMMKKHGIAYYHRTDYCLESKQNYLETTLFNVDDINDKIVSRTNIDEKVNLAKMNEFMVLGSAMTYFRRYHLAVMCGLLADEDTDAGGAIPDKDNKNIKPTGRSVEANATTNNEINFVPIFENLMNKGKSKADIDITLSNYKSQMTSEDYNKITNLITKFYEDK